MSVADRSLRRAVGLPPGHRPLPRRARHPGAAPRAAPGRRAARHAAAARASARLHARATLRRRGPAAWRGLLPRQRHRRGRHRPRRAAHLPRPRPARRLSDHAHRRRRSLPAHDGRRDRRRARRRRRRSARSRHDEGIDYTGVWVQDRKIASIGVHVSRGVTTHGFAVNVDNDLDAVLVGRRLRPARRHDDLARARAPRDGCAGRAGHSSACFRAARRRTQLLRAAARHAPAPRLAIGARHRRCSHSAGALRARRASAPITLNRASPARTAPVPA